MKNFLKAFTLAETVIVIAIIGVIAALTIPSIGQKVDRNKGLFKKAYSVAERTVGELVNDEYYYPFDYNNFGFKEVSDKKIMGTDCYTSTTDYTNCATTRNIDFEKSSFSNNRLIKFCNLYTSNVNTMGNPTFGSGNTNCTFKTSDGIEWKIEEVTKGGSHPISGFFITIDVNGTAKTPNLPTDISKVSGSEGSDKNRDVFYMYVRYDGKMQLNDKDTVAQSYLDSANFNREDKK